MNKQDKTKKFCELFDLLQFYLENRDQPVEEGFDFNAKVEELCDELDLDYQELRKEFKMDSLS